MMLSQVAPSLLEEKKSPCPPSLSRSLKDEWLYSHNRLSQEVWLISACIPHHLTPTECEFNQKFRLTVAFKPGTISTSDLQKQAMIRVCCMYKVLLYVKEGFEQHNQTSFKSHAQLERGAHVMGTQPGLSFLHCC